MKLNDLQPNEGSRKSRKPVGPGISAGQGKTAGKGTKGQSSRSGAGGNLYRQGGNLPFFRRLPFIRGEGFTPPNRVVYSEVTVDKLDRFEAGSVVDRQALAELKLINNVKKPVVILGAGELKEALKVRVDRVTAGARRVIEAAGGTIEEPNQTAE